MKATKRYSRVQNNETRTSRGTRGSLLKTRHSSRRGVLLLVILGMLTLFLMIGTAFIMSGNQYRRANKTYSKVGEQKNLKASQEGFLTEVINQIIRDTANQNSSLRFHSLLRDLYGTEGLVAQIPTTAPLPTWAGDILSGSTNNVTAGQMLEFQIPVANFRDYFGNVLTTGRLSQLENFYKGQVLTFLDGVAKGRSTRVMGYYRRQIGAQPAAILRVLSVALENSQPISDPTLLAGSRILINGRPFNGTGVGYNPLALAGEAKLNAAEQVPGLPDQATLPTPIALMPNSAFFVPVPGTNVAPEYFSTQWSTLTAAQRQALVNHMGFEGQGGSDESYDAPDFQNMFLAWTAPNPVETIFWNFDGTPEPGNPSNIFDRTNLPLYLGGIVLPSFHRPDLINYWAQQTKDGSELALGRVPAVPLLRKVLLRPNWHDHPNFDGSNPEFAQAKARAEADGTPDQLLRMIYGPWDVDNDMDGVRDSVWVDFGAPVMVGSKGRLVKPLAAIMVLDMDGRLNVNAHGTRELAGMGGGLEMIPPSDPAATSALPQADRWNNIPRGQGFGVAEIDLGQILTDNNTLRRLMSGEARDYDEDGNIDLYIPGRYGYPYQGAMGPSDNEPGTKDAFDLSAQLKMQGYPLNLPQRSNFGSLPDMRARYRSALNDFGQFVTTWTPADSNAHSLVEDNPYELDLSSTGARGEGTSVDNPFSLAELERLLRVYDLDAGTLSPRLFELLKGSQPNADPNDIKNWRTLLTTDSYDLPEPSVQLPAWVRLGPDNSPNTNDDYALVMARGVAGARREPVNASFADLIEYRFLLALYNGSAPRALTVPEQNRLTASLKMLIAPEMMAGLKLDLNRPFGNGKDDNNNGVVDEPGEDEGPFWQFDDARLTPNEAANTAKDAFRSAAGAFQNAIDLDGDGTISPAEQNFSNPTTHIGRVNLHNYRRQLLARHLYVLAYALVEPFHAGGGNLSQPNKIKARQLAQWAINAVDFRDPDNIMTAFEYDENPFDGWDVDGDIRSTSTDNSHAQRAVVWGMERPDLLITETLAWHDRRTTDTAREEIDPIYLGTRSDPGTLEDSDPKKRDPHLDQQYRPKGAAFIELYNPNAASAGASGDTHAIRGVNFDVGTSDGAASDYPSPMPAALAGTDLGVNLAAVAVDPANASRRSPVWRIQVVRNRKKSGTTYGNDLNPMLLFYDPEDRESLPVANRPDVDRTIYFAREGSGNIDPKFPLNSAFPGDEPTFPADYQRFDSTDGVEFFTNLAIRPIRPGSYMVVGSGETVAGEPNVFQSPIGLTFVNNNPAQSGKIGQKIQLRADMPLTNAAANQPAPVELHKSRNDAAPQRTPFVNNGGINEFISDVAIINRVIDRTRTGTVAAPPVANRAFTFSEPANGYPTRLPNLGSLWSTANMPASGPEVEGWYVNGPNSSTPLPFDIPLDDNETAVRPTDPDLRHYGTVQGYRWIYLQRLANPLLPFNPEQGEPGHDNTRPVNPYMTIDHSSVNLSVFNGMINSAIVPSSVNPESNYGDPNFMPKSGELASVERGWRNDPADLAITHYAAQNKTNLPSSHNNANPYNVETSGKRPRDNSRFPANGHFFNAVPDCSLGHLNQGFTQNYVGGDKVTPNQPFPWLTWNNRPFANPGELVQVPAMRSSQLLRSFSLINPAGSGNQKQEVYSGAVNPELKLDPQNPARPYYALFKKFLPIKDGPFGHLLNFFRTQSSNNTPTGDGIAGLHRVLDFVSVPSMYVGNETWLNPLAFGSTPVTSPLDPRYGLQPPFNKIASRREPGKVNINTIANGAVWHGLFHGSAKRDGTSSGHPVMDDDGFASVRRGYGTLGDGPTTLNANSPTLFANPFRPGSTGGLVPLPSMLRMDTESTTMRSTGQAPLANSTAVPQTDPVGVPLFSADVTQATNAAAHKHRDSNRNPYFRYSPISRLSSMTTTRSNVFAIWVTVGFFEVEEVEPWTGNADQVARYGTQEVYNRVYPDGYTFGKEAGIETGEVERIREFAIVDRTIPVAFEPGANHNIDEMIRLRRKIKTE